MKHFAEYMDNLLLYRASLMFVVFELRGSQIGSPSEALWLGGPKCPRGAKSTAVGPI